MNKVEKIKIKILRLAQWQVEMKVIVRNNFYFITLMHKLMRCDAI